MDLKIISFNIRYCDDPNGYSIAERAPRLSKVTASYDADLLGFQEMRPEWEQYISKYYGNDYDMFNKYRAKEGDVESSPILWKKDKFELVKTGYFWLSDTPEVESKGWDELCNCHRMCLYVILKHKSSGKQFTFMNTHFGFGDSCHIKSAALIHSRTEKISSNPTFITGDFNMVPESAGYAEMTKYFRDLNALTANDLSTTYHGYHPQDKNSHIDYCFICSDVIPIKQKIITDTVDGFYPSDHYGLYIELGIK